ncbi:hypothetical protein HH212_15160 [Massilia forsythiae]|uniref:Uncharacterized protein n=1 Tax=Massilia forsythiae TaxID=2728020 RepID=A0A7Z2VXQ0_9BURK|nr:hypothetical protein [Massilia forsythiae]QJE01206.1 hypothetical protein HH212_15160 [Massilia forsythiae]
MDANQRSEFNNQTNNGANEKGTPGAEGKAVRSNAPLDHTYPQGSGVLSGSNPQRDMMGSGSDGMGAADDTGGVNPEIGTRTSLQSGAGKNQLSGGSGAVKGITDSHQRVMETQRSSAYGVLEEPVGHQSRDDSVNVSPRGNMQSVNDTAVRDGGTIPPRPVGSGNAQGGQEAQHGNTQEGVAGSHMASNQRADHGGVHQSNDVAGGLPRSPGNAGADHAKHSTDRAGSQTGPDGDEGTEVHDSNDAAGGYPRSPGFANRLAGDSNMDDDTGFKRKP